MFCPDCGKQTPEGKRFCIHCGADIESAVTPVPGGTPPAVTPPPGTPTPAGSISDEDTILRAEVTEVFKQGDVVDDRYEVRSALGTGGMGAVYHVHDREMGEDCALKAMHPHLLASEKAAERFVQEVRVSRKLTHPNIVRVHHLGQWGGLRYLTMELLQGTTLRDWLKQIRQEGRRVPLGIARSIVGQVLEGLAYAHERTIHRDIKPENIFLVGEEFEFQVKLLDFGIAKALDTEALTSTTTSMGTAYYVAPEQLRGEEEIDPRADLYAVGVVLYEMLTGELPTGRFASPAEIRDDIGGEWDEFVLGAMEREPGKRPQNAATMAEGLRRLLEAPKQAPPPPPVAEKRPAPKPLPKPKRNRTGLWIFAAFVLVAAVVGVVWITSQPGEGPYIEPEPPWVEPEPEEGPEFPEDQDDWTVVEEKDGGKGLFEDNPFDEQETLFNEARDLMEGGEFDEAHEALDVYEQTGGDPDRASELRREIFARSVESVRHLVPDVQPFDRMVAAYGGDRPDDLRAYAMGGFTVFTQQGLTIDQETLTVFPDKMYSTLQSPMAASTTILNGDRAVVNLNGNLQPVMPEQIEQSQELLKRDFYHIVLHRDDPGLSRSYFGTGDVNGVPCDSVQVVWDGVETRICIAEDGRVLRSEYPAVNPMTDEPGVNMLIFTDFQRHHGRLVPMRAEHYFNGEQIAVTTVRKVEFNPDFDDAMFWIPDY